MRTCGDCTLCCTLCHVPELDKAEGVQCEHCEKGCTIYAGRPDSCVSYECAWIKEEVPEFMRPDLCGVMVEVYPLMVGAMLAPNWGINDLSRGVLQVLDEFVSSGKPVVATGQFARIPEGMTPEEAKGILIRTVKEYR